MYRLIDAAMSMRESISEIGLKLVGMAGGVIVAAIVPSIPYIIVCTLFVFGDVITAYRLDKRMKRAGHKTDGKFRSDKANKIFGRLLVIYIAVFLAFLFEQVILADARIYLPNLVAGGFAFVQFISMLENESTCNNSTWAKLMQRILISKAARHLAMDAEELHDIIKEGKAQEQTAQPTPTPAVTDNDSKADAGVGE